MGEGAGRNSARFETILYGDGELRPFWRILLYFVLFAFLSIVGQLTISILPRDPLGWGALIVMALASLSAGWILLASVDRRSPGALGFPWQRSAIRESIQGIGIGMALIALAVALLLATGSAQLHPTGGSPLEAIGFFLWTLLFFAIAATWEEAVFRGYPFQVLVVWIGPWPAVAIMAGLFALLHAQNPNVTTLALVNIFLAGVLLSLAYLRTRSLWFATGLHLGWNWTMAALFDFPVSGFALENPVLSGQPIGTEWWTGGAFGPEAGAVGTLVLLQGILAFVRTRRLRPSAATERLHPLVDLRLRAPS